MRLAIVAKFLAVIALVISASMSLPLAWSAFDSWLGFRDFAISIAIGIAISAALYIAGRRGKPSDLGTREAFATVTFSWVVASMIGSLPYLISGHAKSFTNAFFEAMSGFTTTGATILTDVEACPDSMLLWRCQTQWLGGMGIVVLTIALLPTLGVSVNQLFRAEVPGTDLEKIRPRIQDMAILLWKLYMGLTIGGIFLMLAGGMNFHSSLCHIFAAVSTGGFSSWNESVAHYDSAYIEWVLTSIMFICGANFNLLLVALRTRSLSPYRDGEFRFYLYLVGLFTFITTYALISGGYYTSFSDAVRYAAFQIVSIITTTGFATADYTCWPVYTQFMLLILMFTGACSSSTSGAIKCSRIQIVIKHVRAEFRQLIHPSVITHVRNGDKTLSIRSVSSVSTFVALYFIIFFVAALAIAATEQDIATSLGAVAATLGNVGPGLGIVGPSGNFDSQFTITKWILAFCMLCGRLELYTVLVLFSRDTWRK